MRETKPELVDASEHKVVILQNIPQHQGLVKANRFLLMLVFSLVVAVFSLGFLLLPADDVLDRFKAGRQADTIARQMENPALSAEINNLKGQLVGLISGSIESKLRVLEESIRLGRVNTSLGTIQDLKNDVKVLKSYSVPEKKEVHQQNNEALLKEVSQLKGLIYFTLTSCGLMIAAIGCFWVKSHNRIVDQGKSRFSLGKHQ